ncbi:plasmid mobilization relaxosome protein MobC, partial [uncultured Duncaniella sp.]
NANVTAVATPDDMAILRQIGSMANNLNQLAKKANEAGFKLVEWSLKGLSKEIKTLYTRLSYDWRHN